ncbi:hypothetical protein LJR290_006111 [Variovorax sp. LjRoot290]|uniref:hypothetical protein n=1 Tax=Variovorax sp. LjRoot290 TaxID=3342316 RepID=UPI003ECC46EE
MNGNMMQQPLLISTLLTHAEPTRNKNVIKSGGEWIGSIDLENVAMARPAVAMAACIGVRHLKWDERPLLVVMKKPHYRVPTA